MARRKKTPTDGGQAPVEKTTTKIEKELLRKANMVALHKRVDLFDYLDAVIRAAVEADYGQMIEEEEAKRKRTKG